MMPLLIFETHPIQYRTPIYQEMEAISPGKITVVFASDFSIRGYRDEGFQQKIAWDTPLLENYSSIVLHTELGNGINSFHGLTGKGVRACMSRLAPAAVMTCSFGYRFNMRVYFEALRQRRKLWIRAETQDDVFQRSRIKGALRSTIYRTLYRSVDRFFYIGQANREHYLRHGVPESKLRPAHYCTPNRLENLSLSEKQSRRDSIRASFGISEQDYVVAFFGKLIPKKNPDLLFEAWRYMSSELRARMKFFFVGAGEMLEELKAIAAKENIPTVFTGFVNQSNIADYYLASDTVVLPSRKMGETWGLVANEALDAGCAVVVSDAVGCARDFETWDRFRIFPVGDGVALAKTLLELVTFEHDFDWAAERMQNYSVKAAATSLVHEIELL